MSKTKSFDAFIFDFDLTLADSSKGILKCFKHTLSEFGYDIPDDNTIYNTIIVSPPGRGKTTILRDAVRNLSNGINSIGFKGINVGVVDERGEIAAMYKGIPQNDLGKRTDILDNVSKNIGMKMLIRSMAPKIIVADEIGTKEDIEAINYAVCSGVNGLFTAHGNTLNDIINNPILKILFNLKIIKKIVLIEKDRSLKLIFNQ